MSNKEDKRIYFRCGACGEYHVDIYQLSGRLFLECCNCHGTTEVSVQKPTIDFKFPSEKDSPGIMCVF